MEGLDSGHAVLRDEKKVKWSGKDSGSRLKCRTNITKWLKTD